MHTTIMTFMHPDGFRRVDMVRHRNGRYGYIELERTEASDPFYPDRAQWIPTQSPISSLTTTLEEAFCAAKVSIPWLIEVTPPEERH